MLSLSDQIPLFLFSSACHGFIRDGFGWVRSRKMGKEEGSRVRDSGMRRCFHKVPGLFRLKHPGAVVSHHGPTRASAQRQRRRKSESWRRDAINEALPRVRGHSSHGFLFLPLGWAIADPACGGGDPQVSRRSECL
ncbi:hypothetical protein VTI74DRAFT_1595 [Chaetomium olivicolor]